MKHSRQRDSIKNFLMSRDDHPTAETIYANLREEIPSLSLGTVYRNLALLTEMGEIKKISTGAGPDHYDGNIRPHDHVICRKCGKIFDLQMDNLEPIDAMAAKHFDGSIEGHVIYFKGLCRDCLERSEGLGEGTEEDEAEDKTADERAAEEAAEETEIAEAAQ